jgi:hypothetical protein
MNPYPLVVLNHFTMPRAIVLNSWVRRWEPTRFGERIDRAPLEQSVDNSMAKILGRVPAAAAILAPREEQIEQRRHLTGFCPPK